MPRARSSPPVPPGSARDTAADGAHLQPGGEAFPTEPPGTLAPPPIVQPIDAARVVRETFDGVEDFRPTPQLMATPHGLDVIDALPDTHPDRAGLRFKVFHVRADGTPEMVVRTWGVTIPTEDNLARLVNARALPHGEYVVKVWRGGRALPWIRMHFAAPEIPAEGTVERDPIAQLTDLLRVFTGGRPLLGSHAPREEEREAQADILDRLEELAARVEGIEGFAEQLVVQAQQATQQGGDGPILQLLSGFLGKQLAEAPNAPANGSGRSGGGGRLGLAGLS